jgi:hypothetical protein
MNFVICCLGAHRNGDPERDYRTTAWSAPMAQDVDMFRLLADGTERTLGVALSAQDVTAGHVQRSSARCWSTHDAGPNVLTPLRAVTDITNKSLRAMMTVLLGELYSMTRASYDLTRPRRNGLITRTPDRNHYRLTDDGLAFATFYTKVHNRVLRPLHATAAQFRCMPRSAPSTSRSTPGLPSHGYRRHRLGLYTSAKP